MFRSSYIQNLLFSECPVLKTKEKQHKKQEEAQDVAQEISQGARKTRHKELKQTAVHRSRLYVKQDAAPPIGRKKISGTKYGTKTQCKKGRGANHSA